MDMDRRRFAVTVAGATAAQAAGMNLAHAAKRAPETIDEGVFVEINGMQQWITIRGRDSRNPVLLLLHGGPGFPMSMMAPAFAEWEKDFTLVQWDQPGGGATYARNPDRDQGPLTIARYVADGLALTEFLCGRLKTRKIMLLGNSWGTMLGVMMIQRRPDLFAAYVGTSQAVSGPQGAKLGYQLALDAARRRGDSAGVTALERVGPPPYAKLEDLLVRQTYSNPPGLPPTPAEAAASAAQAKLMDGLPAPDVHYLARGLPSYDFIKVFMAAQQATFA